jgi:hypothetical protein
MSKQVWNQPKRIVIRTVWRDGELRPLYGGKMPKLIEGSLAPTSFAVSSGYARSSAKPSIFSKPSSTAPSPGND